MEDEGLVDYTIWVDASKRHPPEPDTSCTITSSDADFIIDNNGSLAQLNSNIAKVLWQIYKLENPLTEKEVLNSNSPDIDPNQSENYDENY
jgi:hypothetical protein